MDCEPLSLELPATALDAIAERVAGLLAQHIAPIPVEREGYIGVEAAAAYLACPRSRVYAEVARSKDRRNPNPIPHAREGQRLLFRRTELDAWIAAGGHVERPMS